MWHAAKPLIFFLKIYLQEKRIWKLFIGKMDDFFSDFSFGGASDFGANQWSEREWLEYVRRARAEVDKVAALYAQNRPNGMDFESIARLAGWNISPIDDADDSHADEPITLINHPIYIASRALIICLNSAIEDIVSRERCDALFVLHLSSLIHEAARLICVAVNSTDLGEDVLARTFYKSAIMCLNSILAKIERFGNYTEIWPSKNRATLAIFDLRQLCLNLSE